MNNSLASKVNFKQITKITTEYKYYNDKADIFTFYISALFINEMRQNLMEITKEKYDEIMNLLKSQEEDIKMLKSVLREEIEQTQEFKNNVVETINFMMLDNANIVSILLAILETTSKNKSLDIADIKQIFILNIEIHRFYMYFSIRRYFF